MTAGSSIIKIGDAISYIAMESYPGGKAVDGTYQKIINQIPDHREFISGFFGHCGITRIKTPAELTVGIEPNKSVVKEWARLQYSEFPDHQLFSSFHVINDFFLNVIDDLLPSMQNPFVYLDPPYPMNSRKSDRDLYAYEMTDEDHHNLMKWCVKQSVPIAISTYPNKIYKQYLKDWRLIKYKAKTRRGSVTELLYMNYNDPVTLHDYRFIGNTFRQREKFKRRCNSMRRKFAQLTAHEQAMLQKEFAQIINERIQVSQKDAFLQS